MRSETKFTNPLNAVFDIEINDDDGQQHYLEIPEAELNALVPATEPTPKDEEDIATDAKIDAVYDVAMETFHNQTAMMQIIEPRYAARNAEVAASYLNIALSAATSKAKLKTDRKRALAFIPGAAGARVTNNTIVASREDILKMINVDSQQVQVK